MTRRRWAALAVASASVVMHAMAHSPHTAILRSMSAEQASKAVESVLIVRVDEGVICMACYGKQLEESRTVVDRLPPALRSKAVLVRLVVLRRAKDAEGRTKAIPERTSLLIADVGGEIAAACRKADPYGDLFVVYPNGTVTSKHDILEAK